MEAVGLLADSDLLAALWDELELMLIQAQQQPLACLP
jgi:hypothetical protein